MILIYTGIPGAGKTTMMVEEARLRVKRQRVQVFTNMVGLKFPEAVYLGRLDELAYVGRGLVLLDEASVCLSSRHWQSVNRQVLSAFAQSRKNGLDLMATAQHIERVDTVVREICNVEVKCRKMGPFVLRTETFPAKQEVFRRSVRVVPRFTYALFDTLERIAIDGSGGAVSLVRHIPSPTYAKQEVGGGMVDESIFSAAPYRARGQSLWLSREGKEAARTVAANDGALAGMEGEGFGTLLRREIERRRWLACFGLRSQDVAAHVTVFRPWAAGWSPEEVMLRLVESEGSEEQVKAGQVRRQR